MAVYRIGVKGLLINEKGQFLALHKAYLSDDKLELPGGRLEFGETMEETLIREMQEELNIQVVPQRLLDTWQFVQPKKERHLAGVIYLCTTDSYEGMRLSEEHDQLKWLNISELDEMSSLFEPVMRKWNWDEIMLLKERLKK